MSSYLWRGFRNKCGCQGRQGRNEGKDVEELLKMAFQVDLELKNASNMVLPAVTAEKRTSSVRAGNVTGASKLVYFVKSKAIKLFMTGSGIRIGITVRHKA